MHDFIMIDIEALGLSPGSVVTEVGAVTGDGHRFHVCIDAMSGIFAGLSVDQETVQWWHSQRDGEAAKIYLQSVKYDCKDALEMFATWLEDHLTPETELWCQGTSYDFPLLEAAFRAIKVPVPWKFWQQRDSRTLFKVASSLGWERPKRDTKHNALQDAIDQSEDLKDCQSWLANRISFSST